MNKEKLRSEVIYYVSQIAITGKIYNEASLQFEIWCYLRAIGYIVEFERNISEYRSKDKEKEIKKKDDQVLRKFIKKEIDLVVFDLKRNKKIAIEFKFSIDINWQVPEKMYSFIKDLKFLESLRSYNLLEEKFDDTIFLAITNNSNFWDWIWTKERTKVYYEIFRWKNLKLEISSWNYNKPTWEKDEVITLDEDYTFTWEDSWMNGYKFFII